MLTIFIVLPSLFEESGHRYLHLCGSAADGSQIDARSGDGRSAVSRNPGRIPSGSAFGRSDLERRRLSGFLRRPTEDRLRELAAEEYISLTPDEAQDMAILVDRYLNFADRLDDLPQPELPVKYNDRDKGYRPTPEEDPCNVFIRKCRVAGAGEGKLKGKLVGVKDNISVASVPTTNGSRMIEGFTPAVDATVVERLLDAGATIVGKLNCDDFPPAVPGRRATTAWSPIPTILPTPPAAPPPEQARRW